VKLKNRKEIPVEKLIITAVSIEIIELVAIIL
jgi:hypothetical protein